MDTGQEREQWTHEDVVTGGRQALLAELDIDGTELGQEFLQSPIGPRVRVGGVRASFARFAADAVAGATEGVRYGGFVDASDEVVLNLPAQIEVQNGLKLPVLSSVSLKLRPFAAEVATRGAAQVGAELRTRKHPEAR